MKNRLFLVLFTLLFYFALTSTVMADADCSLPGGCTTSLTITNKSPSVPILYDGTNDWASPGNIGNYFDFTAEFYEYATPANVTISTPPDLNLSDLTFSCSTSLVDPYVNGCTNAIDAGSYYLRAVLPASPADFTAGGAEGGYEEAIFIDWPFTIEPLTPTVTWAASPANFVFDGTVKPVTATVDSNSVVSADLATIQANFDHFLFYYSTYPTLTTTADNGSDSEGTAPKYVLRDGDVASPYNVQASYSPSSDPAASPWNLATPSNYTAVTYEHCLTISPNQLTVEWATPSNISVVYNGLAHHELETLDSLSITSDPVITNNIDFDPQFTYYPYDGTTCGSISLAGAPVNTGSYCVHASVADDASPQINYLGDTTDQPVILTITPNQITVDWASSDAVSFVYDGEPHDELEDSVTYPITVTSTPEISGFSATPGYSYYSYDGSVCDTTPLGSAPTDAGTYCVTAEIPDDPSGNQNYLGGVTVPARLLTITPNQLSVEWASPSELIVPYNGLPHPELEDSTSHPLNVAGNPAITGLVYDAPTYSYYDYAGDSSCDTTPLSGAPILVGSYCVTATIPDDTNGNFLGDTTNPAKLLTIEPISDLAIDFTTLSRTEPYTGNPTPWLESDLYLYRTSLATPANLVTLLDSDIVTFNYYTDPGLSSPANFDAEAVSKVGNIPVDAGTYYVTAEIAENENHNGDLSDLSAMLEITPAETELKATWPEDNVLRIAITVDNQIPGSGSPISGTVCLFSDAAMSPENQIACQEVSGLIPLTVVFENLPDGINPFYAKFTSTSPNFGDSDGSFVPGENTFFFTVTYDGNGADSGTVPVDTTGYVLDQPVTVSGNTGLLGRSGYFFGGWYIETDPDTIYGPEYIPTFEITSDITLLAKWGHGIVYDPGTLTESGTAPTDNKNPYDPGESFTILNNNSVDPLIRTGYHFQKWNTSPDGYSGDDYLIGRTYPFTFDTNLVLYPHWEANFPRPDGEPGQEGWYVIGNPRIPGRQEEQDPFRPHMPNTGFSTRNMTLLRPQPAALAYSTLDIAIEIPVLDVQTELVSVPEEGGSWAVDWLGARAGLLEGSVLPGQGISYIAAHNHLNNLEAGPFLFLLDLKENDRIFVRNGDELLTYTVYANELFEPDDFGLVEQKASEFENSVVLITCENESTDGGYLNRRVVFAKPL